MALLALKTGRNRLSTPACPQAAHRMVKSMPLCGRRAAPEDSKADGAEAQPMVPRESLMVLLHWAGPEGGEPWVTFSQASLTAEEACIHIAHKVGECGASGRVGAGLTLCSTVTGQKGVSRGAGTSLSQGQQGLLFWGGKHR